MAGEGRVGMAAVPAAGGCPQPGTALCSLQHSQGSPVPASALALRATPWWGTEPVLSTVPPATSTATSKPPSSLSALGASTHCPPRGSALPSRSCSHGCEHTHTHTRCPAAPGLLAEVTQVPEPGQAQHCLLLLPTWGTPRGSTGKSHSQVFTARPHSGPLVSSLLPPSPPPAAPRTEIVPG